MHFSGWPGYDIFPEAVWLHFSFCKAALFFCTLSWCPRQHLNHAPFTPFWKCSQSTSIHRQHPAGKATLVSKVSAVWQWVMRAHKWQNQVSRTPNDIKRAPYWCWGNWVRWDFSPTPTVAGERRGAALIFLLHSFRQPTFTEGSHMIWAWDFTWPWATSPNTCLRTHSCLIHGFPASPLQMWALQAV